MVYTLKYMLIDDVTIKAEAGNGGRGAVAFNKNLGSLGPAGGSGGRGGSIYFEGVSDLSALAQFRFKKDIKAPDGEPGKKQFRDGADGGNLILKIPVGTAIRQSGGAAVHELLKIGERILIAKGGLGGKGNFLFRSPHRTSPELFQKGLWGERFALRLELKMIADVGLVGFPNAGKSSLLNELTRSQSRVANYPFTTLEPNLGVYFDLILADIPGLIEGASGGKGLGIKFLRHAERTKTLFHLVSAESASPVKDYRVIRGELKKFSKDLLQKTEYVFLSKSDMVSGTETKKKVAALKKVNKNTLAISVHDWDSLEKVKNILNRINLKK